MSAVSLLNTFLNKVSFERSPFQPDYSVSRLSSKGEDQSNVDGSTLRRKTAFGFIPVFDNDGNVSIYARLGGPEVIRKGQGITPSETMDVRLTRLPEIELSSTLSLDLDSFYGSNADGYRDRYDTVVDGSENLSYVPSLAYERDMLQNAVLGGEPLIPMAQVCRYYPFRLVPEGRMFKVQFAVGDSYKDLKSEAGYAELLIGIIESLLEQPNIDMTNVTDIFTIAKNPSVASSCVSALLTKMGEDLITNADVHLLSWEDFPDLFSGNSNAYDGVFMSAFLQLSNINNVESESEEFENALMGKVDSVAASLREFSVNANVVEAAAESAAEYFAIRSVSADDARKAVAEQVKTLKTSNAQLRAENAELAGKAKHATLHRAVGALAGAGSAYLAVRDQDLEDWQKMLSVAVGGVLGMIPIVNYVTIAAAPVIVDQGLKLARGRRSLVQTATALPAPQDAPLGLPLPSNER